MSSKNNDAQTGRAALHFLEQANAIHLVHTQIGNDQIRPHAGQRSKCCQTVFCGFNIIVFRPQTNCQQAQQAGVVVNDQQAGFAFGLWVHGYRIHESQGA